MKMFHTKFNQTCIIHKDNKILIGRGYLQQFFYILSSFSTNIYIKIFPIIFHEYQIINEDFKILGGSIFKIE